MGNLAPNTVPRRWAKVLIVDGVMAVIRHAGTDDDGYEIRCSIQCDGAETSAALQKSQPFSQEAFDEAGADLVRAVIFAAGEFGLTPTRVSDGSTFSSLLDGGWICAANIDHQVAELDLALNGAPTPGVTLGMLLGQARDLRAALDDAVFASAAETLRASEPVAVVTNAESSAFADFPANTQVAAMLRRLPPGTQLFAAGLEVAHG